MTQIHPSDQTMSVALPKPVQFCPLAHDKQKLLTSSYCDWSLMWAHTHPQGQPNKRADLPSARVSCAGAGARHRHNIQKQVEIPARLGFSEAVNPRNSLLLPWGELLWPRNAMTGYGCSHIHGELPKPSLVPHSGRDIPPS